MSDKSSLPGDFDFSKLDADPESSEKKKRVTSGKTGGTAEQDEKPGRRKGRKRKTPIGLLLVSGGLCIGIGVCGYILFSKPAQPVTEQPTASSQQPPPQKLTRQLQAQAGNDWMAVLSELIPLETEFTYSIVKSPDGVQLDSGQNTLAWTPPQSSTEQPARILVRGVPPSSDQAEVHLTLSVLVAPGNRAPQIDPIASQQVTQGEGFTLQVQARDPDSPGDPLRYELLTEASYGLSVAPDTGQIKWNPDTQVPPGTYDFSLRVQEPGDDGLASTVAVQIVVLAAVEQPAEPLVAMDKFSGSAAEPTASDAIAMADPVGETYGDEEILQLYRDRELFKDHLYETLRGIDATRFEQTHQDDLKAAFGEYLPEVQAWFEVHPVIKEELFTAIHPEYDSVVEVLRMFDALRREFPEQVVTHTPLAIAVALVWDQDKGVYRYNGHQRRTHSTLPDEMLDGIENFRYFLTAENIMQGRGKLLPWEFLVNVVNHTTPMEERRWAVSNYLPKRVMFGKCYHDVPYDTVMLETQSQTCRLDGKDYTLPNLREFGGVCAMQADYAARVGKSLGVPAAYVSGQGRFGGSHAWVMWVELQSITKQGIGFALKSHGRYRGDNYYIGNLRDPHTGQPITDRQLELRLQAVGIGPLSKRRADWLMKSYDMIREAEQLDVLQQLQFLDQVLKVCPLHEPAWHALAEMSREGQIDQKYEKLMLNIINGMFKSFAAFPDFTWEVFDDLIAFQELPKRRNALYEQLVQLYENAGRPDLAMKARLTYTDYLVADEQLPAALTGLAYTIRKFPQEGRYVPPMLDRLEEIAASVNGAQQQVLAFYRQFLPTIEQKRGSRPSKYCLDMYRRGIERFQQSGDAATASLLQIELQKLQGNI